MSVTAIGGDGGRFAGLVSHCRILPGPVRHLRVCVSVSNTLRPSHNHLSFMMLSQKRTLPTASRSWQSGKVLTQGNFGVASLHLVVCNALQRPATTCKDVQRGATTCNEMQRPATTCNEVQRHAMHCKRGMRKTCNVQRPDNRVQRGETSPDPLGPQR